MASTRGGSGMPTRGSEERHPAWEDAGMRHFAASEADEAERQLETLESEQGRGNLQNVQEEVDRSLSDPPQAQP
jgi:hypothetical protein